MIRYLKREQLDETLWNDCIEKAVNHRIYGYAWYLDLVCETWDALVEDDYAAVFPLPYRKKCGVRYLYQPDFTQQLGLFSRVAITPGKTDSFLASIPGKFRFAEIFLNSDSFPGRYPTTVRNNYELDLSVGYDQIIRNYSTNLARNLRKREDTRLHVSPHPDIDMLISIFRSNRGETLSRWNDQTYQRLSRLIHSLEHRGQARAWGGYNETNELIAGAVFFFDHKHAILIFSALTPEGKDSGAMPLLIDHLIREFAGTPLILDFEGSMDPGLARFYGSFGADIRQYWFWKMNRLPSPLRWLRSS
jgi:hypothetical protein